MYALTFWFPLLLIILIVYGVFREDITKVYDSLGLALLAAFVVPLYPFILLFIAGEALRVEGKQSEDFGITVFNCSIAYYVAATIGLIRYTSKTKYKGLGITGIVISTLPSLAVLFIFIAVDGMDWP